MSPGAKHRHAPPCTRQQAPGVLRGLQTSASRMAASTPASNICQKASAPRLAAGAQVDDRTED